MDLKDPNLTASTAHNLIQGWYENVEREFVRKYVDPESNVVELGGGIGYITAIVARELDQKSKQIVVEANPDLVSTLKDNIQRNDLSIELVPRAYSTDDEPADLYTEPEEFVSGTIVRSGPVQISGIETTTLEELCNEFNISEFVLVADIEGAEYELIDDELDTIYSCCETLIIEFHGEREQIRIYSERLQDVGCEEVDRKDKVLVFQK